MHAPNSGSLIFGIKSAAVSLNKNEAYGYIGVIGVRDMTLAFMNTAFTLLRDRRAVGLVKLGGIFATAGDAIVCLSPHIRCVNYMLTLMKVMYNYSDDPLLFIGAHLVTGIPLFILCGVLLGGSNKSVKAKQ